MPSRNREWTLSRCLTLEPLDDAQRTAKIDTSSLAHALDHFIRQHFPTSAGRFVELVRRTRQGAFQVQFFADHFTRARGTLHEHDISLADLGVWKLCRSSSRSSDDLLSVVVSRIPVSMSSDAFVEEFALSNGSRFSGFDSSSLRTSLRSVSRLPRRKVSGSGLSEWVPSSSLRCVLDRKLGETLLASGSLVIGFRYVKVRPYHPPDRFCFHCGREGHLARFCHSPLHCRRYGAGHALRDCPLRTSSSSDPLVTGPSSRSALHDDSKGSDPSPSSCP